MVPLPFPCYFVFYVISYAHAFTLTCVCCYTDCHKFTLCIAELVGWCFPVFRMCAKMNSCFVLQCLMCLFLCVCCTCWTWLPIEGAENSSGLALASSFAPEKNTKLQTNCHCRRRRRLAKKLHECSVIVAVDFIDAG